MSHAGHRNSSSGDAYKHRLFRALLSAVLPGVGQLSAGARRRGIVLLVIVAAVLVSGVFVALQGVDQILLWWVEPPVLLALLGVNAALLVFRLFAVLDAFVIRRVRSWIGDRPEPEKSSVRSGTSVTGAGASPTGWRIVAVGIALGLLLVLTILPHAVAGYYTYVSYDLLTSVFVNEDGEKPVPTSVPVTTAFPASTTLPGPNSTGAPPLGSTSTTAAPATTVPVVSTTVPPTVSSVVWGDDQQLTIMFIGTDEGYGRSGARADVIMVANFDLTTGRVALFSIPRNTGSVQLSDEAADALGMDVYKNLISSLYSDALAHPELAPEEGNPGAEVLRDAVSAILGMPVDYYAVVNMGGLVDLIDAFGGVKVNVKERLWVRLSPPTGEYEWKVYDIQPGIQHLEGLEALAFARSRTGSNDYVRMGRQRCVIAALLDQNGMAEMAWKFPTLAGVIKDNVKTDIPLEALQDLIGIRSELKTDEMITVGFTPPTYVTGRNSLGYNILDLELIQSTVRAIIEHPEEVLAAQDDDMEVDTSDCWDFEE